LKNTSDNKQASTGIAKIGIMIAIVAVIVVSAGVWYYFSQVRPTEIEKIFNNPAAYTGKEVTVAGEVMDRTAIFGVLKFYKLKDKSGEMIVVTKKSLPEIRSTMGVTGRIDDAFPLGDQKLVVFMEGSAEKKTKSK
jgi:flagellar basal body-associated protein FliL